MNHTEKAKLLIEFWSEKREMYKIQKDRKSVERCQKHINLFNMEGVVLREN